MMSRGLTFALWRVLAAISQNVYLVHDSIGLEKLAELFFGPGPRNLPHKHLNGVNVWLIGVVQRPVHLLPTRNHTTIVDWW